MASAGLDISFFSAPAQGPWHTSSAYLKYVFNVPGAAVSLKHAQNQTANGWVGTSVAVVGLKLLLATAA